MPKSIVSTRMDTEKSKGTPMEIFIIVALVCCGLGYAIAPDDKKGLGAILGLLLGPIGLIVAALLKSDS